VNSNVKSKSVQQNAHKLTNTLNLSGESGELRVPSTKVMVSNKNSVNPICNFMLYSNHI
jgi:hypothetical protein